MQAGPGPAAAGRGDRRDKVLFLLLICLTLLPVVQAAVIFNSSESVEFNVSQAQIGLFNGTGLVLNDNALYRFFQPSACSGNQFITRINSDGTYDCTSASTGGDQNLSEVLVQGNVANTTLDMSDNNITNIDRLGVGTGSPAYELDVHGKTFLGNDRAWGLSTNAALMMGSNVSSDWHYHLNNLVIAKPQDNANWKEYYGAWQQSELANSNNANWIIGTGGYGTTSTESSGNVSDMMAGVLGQAQHYGNGTVAKAIGGYFSIANHALYYGNDGVIKDAIGVYVDDGNSAGGDGPVNTQYGVLVQEQKEGDQAYAIYTNGSTPSRFGGNVSIDGYMNVSGEVYVDDFIQQQGEIHSYYDFGGGNHWAASPGSISFDLDEDNDGTGSAFNVYRHATTNLFTVNEGGNVEIPNGDLEVNSGKITGRPGSVHSVETSIPGVGAGMNYPAGMMGMNAEYNGSHFLFNTDGSNNGGGVMWSSIHEGVRIASVESTGGSEQALTPSEVMSDAMIHLNTNGNVDIPNGALDMNGNEIRDMTWMRLADRDSDGNYMWAGVESGTNTWGIWDEELDGWTINSAEGSGNVEIPNGNLNMSGNDIANVVDIEADPSASYMDLNLGSAGQRIGMYDRVNGQLIAAFHEGGNVEIPNGNLNLGSVPQPGSDTMCWDGTGASDIGDCTSLRKYKNNISALSLGLETIQQLKPRTFRWDENMSGEQDLGFVAEEVEAVEPLLADYNGENISGVKYRQMTALLTKGIQELVTKTEQLEQENAALKTLVCQDYPSTTVCAG